MTDVFSVNYAKYFIKFLSSFLDILCCLNTWPLVLSSLSGFVVWHLKKKKKKYKKAWVMVQVRRRPVDSVFPQCDPWSNWAGCLLLVIQTQWTSRCRGCFLSPPDSSFNIQREEAIFSSFCLGDA